jgi:flagellar hook assembly protein FlgD
MVTIDFTPTVGIEENAKGSSSLNIYPNPITSQASITYVVNEAGPVTIETFDVMGKKVKTLLNDNLATGEYQISWDCRNDNGVKLVPGIYLCTFKTAHNANTQRILVK